MRNLTTKLGRVLRRYFMFLVLPVLVMACHVELYTGLLESEANEMLALLLKNDIQAEKQYDSKGKKVTLMVDEADVAAAIELLKAHGLPKERFTNPGEMFKDEGLISSPMQENARYVYAMSQDLAGTLSQLDGILTARVHLVLPDALARKKENAKASAGVMIRYAKGLDVETYTPRIKTLIMNSVPGIEYENISIAFFPGKAPEAMSLNPVTSHGASGFDSQDLESSEASERSQTVAENIKTAIVNAAPSQEQASQVSSDASSSASLLDTLKTLDLEKIKRLSLRNKVLLIVGFLFILAIFQRLIFGGRNSAAAKQKSTKTRRDGRTSRQPSNGNANSSRVPPPPPAAASNANVGDRKHG